MDAFNRWSSRNFSTIAGGPDGSSISSINGRKWGARCWKRLRQSLSFSTRGCPLTLLMTTISSTWFLCSVSYTPHIKGSHSILLTNFANQTVSCISFVMVYFPRFPRRICPSRKSDNDIRKAPIHNKLIWRGIPRWRSGVEQDVKNSNVGYLWLCGWSVAFTRKRNAYMKAHCNRR